MADLRAVVGIYGRIRIEQRGEGVGADIADFRRVFLHAVQHVDDMLAVELLKDGAHDIARIILAVDADGRLVGAAGLRHQPHVFGNLRRVAGVVLHQRRILDVLLDNFLD